MEFRCDLDFAQKPLGPEARTDLRAKHLDGDWTAVLQVGSQAYRSHPTPTDLALKGKSARQGGLEPIERIGHGITGSDAKPSSNTSGAPSALTDRA